MTALIIMAMVAIVAVSGCDKDDGELKALDPDGSPDLVIAKEVDLNGNRTPFEGAVIRYLITVRNNGTWDADAVSIRDSLPAQVTFLSADAEQGEYSVANHRWNVGIVPPDSVFSLALTVTVNLETQGQVVTNTARVVAMNPADDAPADNQATVLFAVLNGPPIAVDDAYTCAEGDTLEVAAPGILENDHDLEDDDFELSEEPVSAPWHGELELQVDGSFVYRHDGSEAAVDSFTYLITDTSDEPATGLVRLTILPVNDPPVVWNDLFDVDEGGTVAGSVLDNDTDPEDDSLTAILASEPSHAASFEFGADGHFSYTHDGSESTLDSFAYFADDGTDPSGTATVNITIGFTNDPPIVADIPDQEIDEGGSFTDLMLDDYVHDADNANSELTWTHSGAVDLLVTIDPGTHIATATAPDEEWSGSETITFRATDLLGSWGEDEAVFLVRLVNDPPLVDDIPDQDVVAGESFAVILLDNFVNDVDHDVDEMTWSHSGAVDLLVTIDPGTRIATVAVPNDEWMGSEIITFRATDPGGAWDEDVAVFTVVNEPPVVADIPDQNVVEGESFAAILLDDHVDDPDHDDDEMTWTHSGANDLLVIINPTTRIATLTAPDDEWTGTEVITLRATDPGGAWDEDAVVFVVQVNDPPIIDDIPDQETFEGDTFEPLELDQYVSDPDHLDQDLEWSWQSEGPLLVDIDAVRRLQVTVPGPDWFGQQTVTVQVEDPGGLTDSFDIEFIVTAVNDAPVAAGLPDQHIIVGGSFLPIPLDNYVTDVDNDDDEMFWTFTGNTELLVDISDRIATVQTPNGSWVGTETIIFTVADPGFLWDTTEAEFEVTITAP